MEFEIKDENELDQITKDFINKLQGNEIIMLQGEMGVGKSTFTRYFLKNLGYNGLVTSPTYQIIKSYELDGYRLHHIDAYRITIDSLEEILYEFSEGDIIVCEWPENVAFFEDYKSEKYLIKMTCDNYFRKIKIEKY